MQFWRGGTQAGEGRSQCARPPPLYATLPEVHVARFMAAVAVY